MPGSAPPRVLIGGVGYRHLCDYSVGTLVTDRLSERDWPASVSVEDVSYNPIALAQRLEDDPPGRRFTLAIVLSAVERPGRSAGAVHAYRWDQSLPDASSIQAAVVEAVTGVIALDNTLVVCRHLGVWPATVVVIEAEPAWHRFGDELSPAVAVAVDVVGDLATRLALDPALAARLPLSPLGRGACWSEPANDGTERSPGVARRCR